MDVNLFGEQTLKTTVACFLNISNSINSCADGHSSGFELKRAKIAALASLEILESNSIFPYKIFFSVSELRNHGSIASEGENGVQPCSISYIKTPSVHISSFSECPVPFIISGAR